MSYWLPKSSYGHQWLVGLGLGLCLSLAPYMGLEPAWAQASYFFHEVQPKETLWSISKKYGISVARLQEVNGGLQGGAHIKAGDYLTVPAEVLPKSGAKSATPPKKNSDNEELGVLPSSVFAPVSVVAPAAKKSPKSELALVTVSPVEGNTPITSGGRWHRGKGPKAAVSPVSESKEAEMPKKSVDEMLAFAKKFIGTPYVYGGDTPEGFDCSGYVQSVCRYAGVQIPRIADDQYYRAGKPVPKGEEKAGDLVFFETDPSWPGPSHVGICLGGGEFIHASSSGSVRISRMDQEYYKERFLGSRRVL